MAETVQILRMAYGKGGVAKLQSGKTVFVFGGVPGEEVEIVVTEDHERYAEAKIVSREVKATPDADWADLTYGQQLDAKRAIVQDAMTRNAGLDIVADEVKASPETQGYRNKVEFLDTDPLLGNKECFTAVQGALRFATHGEDVGIFRIGVRNSERTGSFEIAIWTTAGWFPRHEVAKVLQDSLNPTSIVRIISEPGKMRKVKQLEVFAGDGYWRENLSGFKYQVQAPSFFQVNSAQAETLQSLVLSAIAGKQDMQTSDRECEELPPLGATTTARPESDIFAKSKNVDFLSRGACAASQRVADLYCGCGTFTLPLAKAGFDVTGVELAGTSTKDLAKNLKKNNLHAEVICDDVARVIKDLDFDACVVDPPKSGLDKKVAAALLQKEDCKKIVYVSCDPMTLARDLKVLKDEYCVERVTPVDMLDRKSVV